MNDAFPQLNLMTLRTRIHGMIFHSNQLSRVRGLRCS